MLTIYGIKNCSSVKNAQRYFEQQHRDYQFYDFNKTPPTRALIQQWLETIDWQNLLNRKSLTWRNLPQSAKQPIDQTIAIELMLAHPKLIKRPIVENQQQVLVGFDPIAYENL